MKTTMASEAERRVVHYAALRDKLDRGPIGPTYRRECDPAGQEYADYEFWLYPSDAICEECAAAFGVEVVTDRASTEPLVTPPEG